MPYLKQRLETLVGHDVLLTSTSPRAGHTGKLVEVGEDYLGIETTTIYETSYLNLFLIAHVIELQHSPQFCNTCPEELKYPDELKPLTP